eukprot:1179290-Prorocentrum_minimum.AAC.2
MDPVGSGSNWEEVLATARFELCGPLYDEFDRVASPKKRTRVQTPPARSNKRIDLGKHEGDEGSTGHTDDMHRDVSYRSPGEDGIVGWRYGSHESVEMSHGDTNGPLDEKLTHLGIVNDLQTRMEACKQPDDQAHPSYDIDVEVLSTSPKILLYPHFLR